MSVTALPRVDAPTILRHRPRLRFASTSVDLINRLARPRAPFTVEVEGLPLRLAPGVVLVDEPPAISDAVEIVFGVEGGGRLGLRLPAAILGRLARAIQPDLDGLPPDPAGALLAELALAPQLDRAESITAFALRVEAITPPAPRPGTLSLLIEGEYAGESFPAQLDLGPPPALSVLPPRLEALLRLLELLPVRAVPTAPLAATVAFLVGHTRLTLAQLRRLEPGDAVLPDIWHPARGETLVMLGEVLAATATTDRHTSTLKTPLRPAAAQSLGRNGDAEMAQNAGQSLETGTEEADLDAVTVTLAFELGRRSLGLGELKEIGAGHVFDLGLDPDQAVDLIANGTRIGQGEIVEIGERIGVRVVRLFGRD